MGWIERGGRFLSGVDREFTLEGRGLGEPPEAVPEAPPDPSSPGPTNAFRLATSPLPFLADTCRCLVPALFSQRVLNFLHSAGCRGDEVERSSAVPGFSALVGIQASYGFLLQELEGNSLEAAAHPSDLFFNSGRVGEALLRLHDARLDRLLVNGNDREDPEVLRLEALHGQALEDLRRLRALQEDPPQDAAAWEAYLRWAREAAPRLDAVYGELEVPLSQGGSNLDDLFAESAYLAAYQDIYREIASAPADSACPADLPALREGLYRLWTQTPAPDGVPYLTGAGRRRLAEILLGEERFPEAEEWREIFPEFSEAFSGGTRGALEAFRFLSLRHLGQLDEWNRRERGRARTEALEAGHSETELESVGGFFEAAERVVTHQIRELRAWEIPADEARALTELSGVLEAMTSVRMRTRYAREHLPFLHLRAARWAGPDGGETWSRMRRLAEGLPLDYEGLGAAYLLPTAAEVLREGSFLSRSMQLSLAQQFTRDLDAVHGVIAGLDRVVGPNFLDDVILGNAAVSLVGPELDRGADAAFLEELLGLRQRYHQALDELAALGEAEGGAAAWERGASLFETLGELHRASLFGDLSYQQTRTWQLLRDRETIQACVLDAVASFGGAYLASFLTRLPSIVRIARGMEGMLRETRIFQSLRPSFQRGLLNGFRIYGAAAPEAFFQSGLSTLLQGMAAYDAGADGADRGLAESFLEGMSFVFFQRRLRPLFSRLTAPWARLERAIVRWGEEGASPLRQAGTLLGSEASRLGFHLTQLGTETLTFSLYRLRDLGLQWIAGIPPDWERAFSREALAEDALNVLQEYVTERPAELLGRLSARVAGAPAAQALVEEIAVSRTLVQSDDFLEYPPPWRVQRLRIYRDQLEDLRALLQSHGQSFEDLRPIESGDPDLHQALQDLERELGLVEASRRGEEAESRRWLEEFYVGPAPGPASQPDSPVDASLGLAAGWWIPAAAEASELPGFGLAIFGGLILAGFWSSWFGPRVPATFSALLRRSRSEPDGLPARDPALAANPVYQMSPEEALRRYPATIPLSWMEFPLESHNEAAARVFFTGRIFGIGSSKTAYEAFRIDAEDHYRRVCVVVADHRSLPGEGLRTWDPKEVGQYESQIRWVAEHGLGRVEYYGTVGLPGGHVGFVTNIAPGLIMNEKENYSQIGNWIREETLRDLATLLRDWGRLGSGIAGDFQFNVGPDGRVYFVDFDNVFGPGAPSQAWERSIGHLRSAWLQAGRAEGEFEEMRRRVEEGLPVRDSFVQPDIFQVMQELRREFPAKAAGHFPTQEEQTEFENQLAREAQAAFPIFQQTGISMRPEELEKWEAEVRRFLIERLRRRLQP